MNAPIFQFNPVTYHSKYAVVEPAYPIAEGQKVQTVTLDAHGGSPQGVRSTGFSNPLNGPFVIANARPGDSLVVEIDSIQPLGESAWGYAYPLPRLMEASDASAFPDKKIVNWTLHHAEGFVSSSYLPGRQIKIPMQPMLGCIGLACEPDREATSQEAGPFGGNLDFPLLGAGAKIELPVFVPGGYLFIGDAHAFQYGGEMTGAALEVPAEVIFSASLNKGANIEWPRGETQEKLFTLGTDRPFEIAVQHVISGMIRLLQDKFALSHADAATLTAQLGDLQICSLVGPAYTATCLISKSLLSSLF